MKFLKKSPAGVKEVSQDAQNRSKKKQPSAQKPKPSGRSLLPWSLQPALVAIFGIIGVTALLNFVFLTEIDSQHRHKLENLVLTAIKQRVDDLLEARLASMQAISATSQVRMALSSDTQGDSMRTLSSQLLPDLEQLYVVGQDKIAQSRTIYTDLSFASADLLRRVASGEKSDLEAFYHNDAWHYQIAVPVATENQKVTAVLMGIFNTRALNALLVIPPGLPSGQVKLLNGEGNAARTVLSQGQASGNDAASTRVRLAQWRIQYQPAKNTIAGFERTLLWIIMGCAAVLLPLLIWFMARAKLKKIQSDLNNATHSLRSVAAGEGRRLKEVEHSEIKALVSSVSRQIEETAKRAAKAAEKKSQKQKSETRPSKPADTADAPLFDDDLLDLDELAESEDLGEVSAVPEESYGVESGAVVEEIQALDTDVPQAIFRAYDIRGIVDETLNEGIVELLGRALASEALAQGYDKLCVGYDGRLSSPDYCEAITRGIISAGVDAIIIGQVPTPVLYFATHHYETGSGVMITGSHNPANYNGFKMMIGGNTLAGEDIQKLYKRIITQDFAKGQGSRSDQSVADDYMEAIINDIAVAAPLRVVIDAGNGVAGDIAPNLIEELGCEVIPLHCEVDGTFPNHHPDPGKPENLEDLIAAVQEHEADIGLAFDGDGDRIGVVTNTGKIIWPDRLLMLFAKDVVSRNPGADIIFDVKCSRRLNGLITGYGGRPIMWKTGHSLIKAKMQETGALLAGEMSGHIFFKERWLGFDDGLYSAARLLEILGIEDRSADEVFAGFPEDVSTPEINIEVTDENKFSIIEKLSALKEQFQDGNVSTIDGLRVDFPKGWGLCRASNTTPMLVLRFEADDEASLEEIKNQFKTQLKAIDSSLDLSF